MNTKRQRKYGDKRDYPKIHLYQYRADGSWAYVCSTTWARTCREAREQFSMSKGIAMHSIRARFAKGRSNAGAP